MLPAMLDDDSRGEPMTTVTSPLKKMKKIKIPY